MIEPNWRQRITINPEIYHGKPIIRGHRIAVEHIMGMVEAGDTPETILEGYPMLEREDILACIEFTRLNDELAENTEIMVKVIERRMQQKESLSDFVCSNYAMLLIAVKNKDHLKAKQILDRIEAEL